MNQNPGEHSEKTDGAPSPDPEILAREREIYQQIIGRTPEHDFDPTIDRVARLMDLLGAPQHAYKVVQITGTNGKTSTARMVESLVRELGLRTGRFTSPHLHTVRERIVVDGAPISSEQFVALWEDVDPYIAMMDAELAESGQSQLSFFEVLTAMAFVAFADAPVDVAVIEVGMGGQWDSTNVADAEVAVFTPITLDHQRWLGSTVEEIAHIKAGIIKDQVADLAVVSAVQSDEAAHVIAARAAKARAHLVAQGYDLSVADRQLAVGGQMLSLQTGAARYDEIFLPLHGTYQADNALLALAAVEQLMGGAALSGEVVEAGFGQVRSPGRLELVRSSPTVIVDAAHNPAGARAVATAVEEVFAFSRLIGVIAVMADKDAAGILSELEPILDELVITQINSDRVMPAEDLAEIARDFFDEDAVHVVESLPQAVSFAVDLTETGQIDSIVAGTGVLVVGSVVLAGEARALFGITE